MTSNRQLAAIMFTDIEGYTSLMQKSESQALSIQKKHRKIFESLTSRFNGRIINYYGDGTLSIFESAVSAVKCACALQKQFLASPALPVRIGIHMGDILITDVDIIGNSVNIASRIESLGIAGSILISAKVYEEISNHEELPVKSVGRYQFKNDSKMREIFAIDLAYLNVPGENSLKGKTSDKKIGTTPRKKLLKKYIGAAVILISLILLSWPVINWQINKNWAATTSVQEIENLLDQSKNWEAFRVWKKARRYSPKTAGLKKYANQLSRNISFTSEPEGVSAYRKSFDAEDEAWELIGKTPVDSQDVYRGASLWMFIKPGYDTLMRLSFPNNFDGGLIEMNKNDMWPDEMVKFSESHLNLRIPGIDHLPGKELSAFYADKYEVTNKAFKEFIDSGGYSNGEYWNFEFIEENNSLSYEQAMELFVDGTGRPGPAGWELGDYPEGQEYYPVTGVSWYEAAAYARFAGKELPTVYHWNAIANTWLSQMIVPLSNFKSKGLAPAGQFKGMSSNGIYDIAGNAKEWVYNKSNRENEHFILGGSWNDATYSFTDAGTADPWDRSLTNGFRCIKSFEDSGTDGNLKKRIDFYFRDYYKEIPFDKTEFELIKRQFEYDRTPFNTSVRKMNPDSDDWTIEEITFDAAYGDEKLTIYIYLPKNTQFPLQSTIFFPGSLVLYWEKFEPVNNWHSNLYDFIIKSGRAFIYPIYNSTFHRNDELISDYPNNSNYYKERVIMWAKDLRRTIDYLETREEFDIEKLAYYGYSWGAANGILMGAIEPRLKCLILKCGGLYLQPAQKEADLFNYLPYVKQPVLMLNGRYDMFYPLNSSQIPMYDRLGTNPIDKVHSIYDVNHRIPRDILLDEVLGWLDKYLGEIEQ